jgi:hypothetical protein
MKKRAAEAPRPDWLVPIACALLAGALMLGFLPLQYAIDDAWISFRIARNWLAAGVPTFDLTRPAVEGMTNFLWTALAVPVIALLPRVDPIHPMRALGALAHLATVVLAARFAARLAGESRGNPRLAAAVAGGAIALNGSLAFHAMSGLETPLFGLLFVASLDRLHATLQGAPRAATFAGVLLGLLALTRPEGVFAGALVLGGAFVVTRDRRLLLAAALPFAALVLALEAYRWVTYRSLVPNTYYAKSPSVAAGFHYLGDYALFGLGLLGALGLIAAIGRGRVQTVTLVTIVLMAAATVASGGDWMPGFRRFALTTLGLAVLVGDALASSRGAKRALAALAAVGLIGGNAAAHLMERDRATYDTSAMADLAARAAATPEIHQAALLDIGRFGWGFPGSIFDFAGLTDRRIARQHGSHLDKDWDEAYFRERRPDVAFIPSDIPIGDPLPRVPNIRTRTEMFALASLVTNGGYRYRGQMQIASSRYLLVFAREGLALPDSLWGPMPPKDLRQLLAEMPGAR